ncbi:hypothetical protein EJB05_30509, partial [Eragrostis curvula]
MGRKHMTAEWRRRLPELARRLEVVLFTKFSNKLYLPSIKVMGRKRKFCYFITVIVQYFEQNDYDNMMKMPFEP